MMANAQLQLAALPLEVSLLMQVTGLLCISFFSIQFLDFSIYLSPVFVSEKGVV